MTIVRELLATLGISLDPASFKRADVALARTAAAATATAEAAGAPVKGDGVEAKASAASAAFGGLVGVALSAASSIGNAFHGIFNEFGASVTASTRFGAAIGQSAQEVQGWVHAVGRAGVSGDAFKGTLVDIQAKLYSTTTAAGVETVKAFALLGVSISKVAGKFPPATQVFEQAVEKLIAIEDPSVRTGKALATVGQAGLDVANQFAGAGGGIAAFRQMREEVKQFGAELDGGDVQAVKNFGRETSRVQLFVTGLKNTIGGELHRVLSVVTKDFVDWLKVEEKATAGGARAGLRESVGQLSKLGDAVQSLLRFGYRMLPLFGLVVEALVAVGVVVGGVATLITDHFIPAFQDTGAVGIGVAVALFAAFFPLTALFGGIFLLIEDLIGFSKGHASLTGDALAALKKFEEELLRTGQQEPFWLKFLKEFYKLLTDTIPQAMADFLLNPAFKALNRVSAVIAVATGANKGARENAEERALRESDAGKALGFFTGAGDGKAEREAYRARRAYVAPPSELLSGGHPYSEGPAAATAPISSYAPGGPLYSAPTAPAPTPANRSIPPGVTVNVTGTIGALKEVKELVKDGVKEGVTEWSEGVLQNISGGQPEASFNE